MRQAAVVTISTLAFALPAHAQEACTLLTKELITQFSPEKNKQSVNLIMSIPPEGSRVGNGSACEYGGVNLQVDPFAAPAQIEKKLEKESASVTGLGDVAFYRDNRGRWGELYVRVGGRVITLQLSVPSGSTAASIQPNAVGLAKAVLAKLE